MSQQTHAVIQGDTTRPLLHAPEGRVLDGTETIRFHLVTWRGVVVRSAAADQIVDTDGVRKARYQWQAGDLNVPGTYLAEFEITDSAGQIETYPIGTRILVTVTEQLAGQIGAVGAPLDSSSETLEATG